MKLFELHHEPEPHLLAPENIAYDYNQIYEYKPKQVTDQRGDVQRILTVYSFEPNHTGKKSYALEDDQQVLVKVLTSTHLDYDPDGKIQRVRIMSNVDQVISRFSLVHEDFTPDREGNKISFRLKDLPDFENYDIYTDREFFEKFGRARLKEDHGLVGYVYLHEPLYSEAESQSQEVEASANTYIPPPPPDEHRPDSKLERARAIYRSTKHQGRQRVIHIMKTQLGLTQNGASSYYTRVKNEIEEGIK